MVFHSFWLVLWFLMVFAWFPYDFASLASMASFRSFLGIFGQRILKNDWDFFAGMPGGQRAELRSVLPSPERMSRVCLVVYFMDRCCPSTTPLGPDASSSASENSSFETSCYVGV